MDTSQFIAEPPGRLVQIDIERGHDWAFVPEPLSPEWQLPSELWPLVVEAHRELGTLAGLGRHLPNPAILLRPMASREALESSRIEGTYATARQLLLYDLDPTEPSSERDPANDAREVRNYQLALEHGLSSPLPLSLRLLRELHERLLRGVRGQDRTPGAFRRLQVAIGHDRRFVPPPPTELKACLDAFERHLNRTSSIDPLVECFRVHYQFEAIHPFLDGNGRVGRLLLAMMLVRWCHLDPLWLYLSEYFERHYEEYIDGLFAVSARGDWNGWIRFCLEATIRQAQRTAARIDQLVALRQDYLGRLAKGRGSVRLTAIVESLLERPLVRVADLPARFDITYPTAASDIKRLVKAGILRELQTAGTRTYLAPDIFRIVYDEVVEEPAGAE